LQYAWSCTQADNMKEWQINWPGRITSAVIKRSKYLLCLSYSRAVGFWNWDYLWPTIHCVIIITHEAHQKCTLRVNSDYPFPAFCQMAGLVNRVYRRKLMITLNAGISFIAFGRAPSQRGTIITIISFTFTRTWEIDHDGSCQSAATSENVKHCWSRVWLT